MQENGEGIVKDVTNKTGHGLMKWQEAAIRVLCNKKSTVKGKKEVL